MWSPSINTPFCHFVITTLNNQLITAGGKDSSGKVTNKVLLIDDDLIKEFYQDDYTKILYTSQLLVTMVH